MNAGRLLLLVSTMLLIAHCSNDSKKKDDDHDHAAYDANGCPITQPYYGLTQTAGTVGWEPTIRTLMATSCATGGCHTSTSIDGSSGYDFTQQMAVQNYYSQVIASVQNATMPKNNPTFNQMNPTFITTLQQWANGGFLATGTATPGTTYPAPYGQAPYGTNCPTGTASTFYPQG